MKRAFAVVAMTLVAFVAGVSFSAQVKEAWHWPDSMDAVPARAELSEATNTTATLPPRNEGIDWKTD